MLPSAFLLAAGLGSTAAQAAPPEDVSLTSMTEQDGLPVFDRELLGQSFRQLVMELGTAVANQPDTPAETLGLNGFSLDVGMRFALTEARFREGPSPWNRAHADEDNAPYLPMPTLSVRKGLPWSGEIGASVGWIGGSSTGVVGGWARVAVLEGYRPLPDVSVRLGYSGYVGNDELDLGTLDLGVTLGTTWGVGRIIGVNTGQFSPWLSFQTLRVSANPTIDEDIADEIGALRYAAGAGDGETSAPPIAVAYFGGGFQFTSGNAHIRVSAAWAPATIPTLSTGLGFTF